MIESGGAPLELLLSLQKYVAAAPNLAYPELFQHFILTPVHPTSLIGSITLCLFALCAETIPL